MRLEATTYEIRNQAAWIQLNRPQNRNALSAILVNELYTHLQAADKDDAVRSIVITGTDPAFCAGADLKSPPGSVIEGKESVPFTDVMSAMLESRKPVIAAVNGAAFAGGLGLVGAADIVIAYEEAVMSFSEVRIGVIPAVISVVCVPKMGIHHATRLFVTGRRFTGAEAVQLGLVHRAVPREQLIEAVDEEIDMINRGGPIAVIECKKLARRVRELGIDQGFAETSDWSKRMFVSEEGQEGMAAFREKRSPRWIKD